MAKECCMCEYSRNRVWYLEDMELSVDDCTLGHTCDADECPDFEELDMSEEEFSMDNLDYLIQEALDENLSDL